MIPFAYDEAWPFNKYGVAVVETLDDVYLIDTKGKIILGTENLSFDHYYVYDQRFLEFTYKSAQKNDYDEEALVGVYDTKERRIIIEPSVDSIIEWSEEEILVYERGGEFGVSDFRQYYINSKGEKKYPWLNDKGFATIDRPNKSLVAVVAVSKYIELSGSPSSYFPINGKKYKRVFMHGLYSPKGFFLLPMEYEKITEVADNVFACLKDGVYTVIRLDEIDYKL